MQTFAHFKYAYCKFSVIQSFVFTKKYISPIRPPHI